MSFDRKAHSGGVIIFFTFVVAMMIMIMPLPEWAKSYRPDVMVMVLIYWCLALPERVGVGVGWIAGLMLDVGYGSLLGQHALAMAIVAWLTLNLHQRMRVFPPWQQAISVLILVGLNQMLVLWVKGMTGLSPHTWIYWMPSITSMLLWPWLFLVLRGIRRNFKVN